MIGKLKTFKEKTLKKLAVFVVSVLLTFSILAGSPLFASKNNQKAHATGEEYVKKSSIVSADISAEDFETYYGGTNAELSTFTPFDFENESRMAGKSIDAVHDEHGAFNRTFSLPADSSASITNRAGVGLWIYFSGTEVHDFSIKLAVDENNYFEKTINKGELAGLLSKDYDEEGFGWNYFVIPIFDSSVTGTIMNGDEIVDFSEITIVYSSTVLEDKNYANIKIFDVSIVDTVLSSITVTEKQDFAVYKFNFWDDSLLSSRIVGDSLSIKSRPAAVSYAWVGELDLTVGGSISWQVLVRKPGSNQALTYNFGENVVLDTEGEYNVSYRAAKVGEQPKLYLIDTISFNVYSNLLLSFVFPSYRLSEGATKIVSLHPSAMLNMETASIVSIDYDESIVDIETTDNFCDFKVVGKGGGTASVTIKIQVKRNTNNEFETYEATASIICDAKANNGPLQTFLLISLGVILVISLIFGIKSLVKSRKIVVK